VARGADPIWEIMETQGRKLVWLAVWIGVSESHLRAIKAGNMTATPEFRAKCARALQLPERLLFRDETAPEAISVSG
jgi:hypothetical protein